MRRYTITVNDTTKVIDGESAGANLFRVQLVGRLIDVTLEDHSDLAHSAITPAVTPRVVVAPDAVAAAPAPAAAGPAAAAASAPKAAPAASAPVAGKAPAGGGSALGMLTAPMPGVILTVETKVGAKVTRGQTLAILEAMKMKNELKAPRDGVVAEIYVSEGQQVKFGETLVRFEGN